MLKHADQKTCHHQEMRTYHFISTTSLWKPVSNVWKEVHRSPTPVQLQTPMVDPILSVLTTISCMLSSWTPLSFLSPYLHLSPQFHLITILAQVLADPNPPPPPLIPFHECHAHLPAPHSNCKLAQCTTFNSNQCESIGAKYLLRWKSCLYKKLLWMNVMCKQIRMREMIKA